MHRQATKYTVAKTISSLSVGLFGDVSHFANAFGTKAVGSIKAFGSSIGSAGETLLKFSGIGAAVAGVIGAIGGLGEGLKLEKDLQHTTVAMEAMLGSASDAKAVLDSLRGIAANSPFEFPELAEAGKKLAAFGVASDQIAPVLHALGDVAAATGKPVMELAELYGKVGAAGKVSSKQIKELAGSGVPIVKLLAEQFHVTEAEVAGLVKAGAVGLPNLQQALNDVTGEGGRLHGMMEAEGNTIGGMFTKLKTSVGESLQQITHTLLESFNLGGVIASLTANSGHITDAIVGGIKTVVPIIKSVVSTIWNAFKTIYDVVATYSGMVQTAVMSVWNGVYGFIEPIVTSIYETITTNFEAILASVLTYAYGAYDYISGAWSAIWDITSSVWNSTTQLISGRVMSVGEVVSATFGGIMVASKWLLNGMGEVFTALGFFAKNWQDTMEFVGLSVAFNVVKVGNQLQYVFGTVIPEVFMFGIHTIWDGIKWIGNALSNFGSNLVSIFANLPGLIAGTTKWDSVWKPLTDGFNATTKELKIPPRVAGDLENALAVEQDKLGSKLELGLGNALNKNKDKAKEDAHKITDNIKNAFKPGDKPPEVKPKVSPDKVKKETDKIKLNDLKLGIDPELKRTGLLRAGSAEAKMLAYEFTNNIAAATKGKKKGAGVGGVGTDEEGDGEENGFDNGPVSPSIARGPTTPSVTANAGGVSSSNWQQKWLDSQTKMNYWLDRIEQHVRPLEQLSAATF
jgi:tape measure domain-containing protein